MFIDDIKSLIKSNPTIVAATDRGLEDKNRHVVFVAAKLLERYPDLDRYVKRCRGISEPLYVSEPVVEPVIEHVVEEPVAEPVVESVKKKTRKKKESQ